MTNYPGFPSRGSTSGRPIMVLFDVLGKRWTLRILWELKQSNPASFRELRSRCEDVSPTLLNSRLKELRELNLISLEASGFALTSHGESLSAKLFPLDKWANEWAQSFQE